MVWSPPGWQLSQVGATTPVLGDTFSAADAGVDGNRVYNDKLSGTSTREQRPGLAALLDHPRKAVVRRNTEQVQGRGDFALFDELFADDFVDHTPQPGTTPDKAGVRVLYDRLRQAFPDFRPEIHWQTVDGDVVTTFKIYHGTHRGEFLGIAPTGKTIQFVPLLGWPMLALVVGAQVLR